MADQFIPFSTPAEQDPNQFLNKAIRLVRDEIEVRNDGLGGDFHVYIISFGYVLGNWKAYLSSSLPDGKIYEASYDRDKRVTYIDTYGKVRNEPVYDDAEAEEEVLRQQELEESGSEGFRIPLPAGSIIDTEETPQGLMITAILPPEIAKVISSGPLEVSLAEGYTAKREDPHMTPEEAEERRQELEEYGTSPW